MLIGINGKMGSGKDTVGVIIQYLTFINDNLENEDYYPLPSFISNLLCNKNAISEEFETQWKIKKFADKLKDIVCLLIGCTREQLEDADFKNKELGEEWIQYFDSDYELLQKESVLSMFSERLTPRKLLQLLGTECGRNIIHPNVWVNALMSEYKPSIIKFVHTPGSYHCNCMKCGNSFSGIKRCVICENCAGTIERYPDWIITDMRFPNEMNAVKNRGGITIRVNRPGLIESNHLSETSLDSATFDFVISNDKDIEHLINEVRKILEKLNII